MRLRITFVLFIGLVLAIATLSVVSQAPGGENKAEAWTGERGFFHFVSVWQDVTGRPPMRQCFIEGGRERSSLVPIQRARDLTNYVGRQNVNLIVQPQHIKVFVPAESDLPSWEAEHDFLLAQVKTTWDLLSGGFETYCHIPEHVASGGRIVEIIGVCPESTHPEYWANQGYNCQPGD